MQSAAGASLAIAAWQVWAFWQLSERQFALRSSIGRRVQSPLAILAAVIEIKGALMEFHVAYMRKAAYLCALSIDSSARSHCYQRIHSPRRAYNFNMCASNASKQFTCFTSVSGDLRAHTHTQAHAHAWAANGISCERLVQLQFNYQLRTTPHSVT